MDISKSEWEVMRVIWAQEPVKSAQVISILGETYGWSDSTIKTLIGRLVDKGIISSERLGRSYLYTSLVSETVALRQQIQALFGRICVRRHADLLLEQLAEIPLRQEDCQALRQLLVQKEKEVVEDVPCNCIVGQCTCSHHLASHKEVKHG